MAGLRRQNTVLITRPSWVALKRNKGEREGESSFQFRQDTMGNIPEWNSIMIGIWFSMGKGHNVSKSCQRLLGYWRMRVHLLLTCWWAWVNRKFTDWPDWLETYAPWDPPVCASSDLNYKCTASHFFPFSFQVTRHSAAATPLSRSRFPDYFISGSFL